MHAATTASADTSGIYPLPIAQDAFAARCLLARAAERSLDVQYYIWHGDTTGYLLLQDLWSAAERGVRVRLLLDDNGVTGLDPTIAALDSHHNIEIRLFNPFPNRRFKSLGYLSDFRRLNRRMHNKSFTADSVATIVGGRNVGDDYFGAGQRMLFFGSRCTRRRPRCARGGASVRAILERYIGASRRFPRRKTHIGRRGNAAYAIFCSAHIPRSRRVPGGAARHSSRRCPPFAPVAARVGTSALDVGSA